MKLYKLTDREAKTLNGTRWGPAVRHEIEKVAKPKLCSSDVIHAYQDADLALLMNQAHAGWNPLRLWEAEGTPCVSQPDKVGCFWLTIIRELDLPAWYKENAHRKQVERRFGILAARAVLPVFEGFLFGPLPRKAIEAAEARLTASLSGEPGAYQEANFRAHSLAREMNSVYGKPHRSVWAAWAARSAASDENANAAAYAAFTNENLDLVSLAKQAIQELKS